MSKFKSKIKAVVFRTFLEKHPKLLSLARKIQFKMWQRSLQGSSSEAASSAEEILTVDPSCVRRYIGEDAGHRYEIRGKVNSGDWDQKAGPFDKWDLYQAMHHRFKDQAAWEDSAFYQRVAGEIRDGRVKWGCSTVEAFNERLLGLEGLYQTIREQGYQTQTAIREQGEDPYAWEADSPFNVHDEVTICFDREGRMLAREGKHRLSIAKLLGLETIPAVAGLRHHDWHQFRLEVQDWVNSRNGIAYQPFTHPDLQHIPAQHDDGRFELMMNQLTFTQGSVIDIGSFFGYFCHRFERAGFTCTAVEIHPKHIYFMKKLRAAEERTFSIMEESILDGDQALRYDVVLALNIFHHFLKTQESFDALKRLLGRLEMKVMFFQPHCPDDHVTNNMMVNFEPDEFVQFVLDHSCLTRSTKLQTVARGRVLYVLEC